MHCASGSIISQHASRCMRGYCRLAVALPTWLMRTGHFLSIQQPFWPCPFVIVHLCPNGQGACCIACDSNTLQPKRVPPRWQRCCYLPDSSVCRRLNRPFAVSPAYLPAAEADALLSLPAAVGNWDTATAALPGSAWQGSQPCGGGGTAAWKGVNCTDGQVTELALPGLGLAGTLPDALAGLAFLRRLDLSGNTFTGGIPTAWVQPTGFPRLAAALLNGNQLGGAPGASQGGSQQGALRCRMLVLQFAVLCCAPAFQRGLPAASPGGDDADAAAPCLLPCCASPAGVPLPQQLLLLASEQINLGGNRFNGSLPANWNSSTLADIDLSDNQLTGALPPSWGAPGALPKLGALHLKGNDLAGVCCPAARASSVWCAGWSQYRSGLLRSPGSAMVASWHRQLWGSVRCAWLPVVATAGTVPDQWTAGAFAAVLMLEPRPQNPRLCGECHPAAALLNLQCGVCMQCGS